MLEKHYTYGAMIARAGPCVKSACPSQYSNCLDNSGPITKN